MYIAGTNGKLATQEPAKQKGRRATCKQRLPPGGSGEAPQSSWDGRRCQPQTQLLLGDPSNQPPQTNKPKLQPKQPTIQTEQNHAHRMSAAPAPEHGCCLVAPEGMSSRLSSGMWGLTCGVRATQRSVIDLQQDLQRRACPAGGWLN